MWAFRLVKGFATILGIGLFGVFLALLAIELVFRLLPADREAIEEWNDRPRVYFMPENAPSLRGGSYVSPKPSETFRIAVVGDSFAFAPYMQFDDTFSARLERILNLNAKQHRVEVINYGVPRYSTTHEIALVKRAIDEQADLVILQITLNDPELKPYRPTGLLEEQVNRWGQLELNYGIYRYWRSLAFVVTRIYNSGTRDRYKEYFFELFENPKSYKSFTGALQEIITLTTAAKIPLVAVTFPLFGLPLDDEYPFVPLHEKVAAAMQAIDVPNLDLLAIYRGIPIERLKVMPIRDFHPNEIAHRMAAEELYAWLVELDLLPSDVIVKRTVPDRVGICLPELAGKDCIRR